MAHGNNVPSTTGAQVQPRPVDAAPSAVARKAAAALWPDVHHQQQLAPGAYQFSCAGHGGIVAVLDVADLPEHAVVAARASGLIDVVARGPAGGGRSRYYTSIYGDERVRAWVAERPDTRELTECWVGEEDCGWATLAVASPAICEGLSGTLFTPEQVRQVAFETCQRWTESFLVDLDPDYEPLPMGELRSRERRDALVADGAFLIDPNANGNVSVGQDVTRLRLTNAAGDHRHLLVSTAAYKRLQESHHWNIPTVRAEDYIAVGAVELAEPDLAAPGHDSVTLERFTALGGQVLADDQHAAAA